MGSGNPWVVSKKSDFGATHYINLKKTAKNFKNFIFDIFGPFQGKKLMQLDQNFIKIGQLERIF